MRQVIIIHGWSDGPKSFHKLGRFLLKNGYQAIPIWLGDYISLDDDVAVKDVAKRMKAVLQEKADNQELDKEFDMIVHSTGGLVAREWIASFGGRDCPVKRLVMLAPANFGSRLASLGQSMLGRVVKGWNNWFQTGKRMLSDLELCSTYQWELARRDLFSDSEGQRGACYGLDKVWPFVIVGSMPYSSSLRKIISEPGADGTVRVAAANMNVKGVTVDFTQEGDPTLTPWPLRHGDSWRFPLAVVHDRDHGSVTNPAFGSSQLGELILSALKCDDIATYQRMREEWEAISEETALLGLKDPKDPSSALGDGECAFFHQYLQVNVHVIDDHGEDVPDFFLEFMGPEKARGDGAIVYFQQKVLRHVHVNSRNPSYRCLFIDRSDLLHNLYREIKGPAEKKLNMSISATPRGVNVGYFANQKKGAAGWMTVHQLADNPQGRWLQRNTTHFCEIIIPRNPAPGVFKLNRLPPA